MINQNFIALIMLYLGSSKNKIFSVEINLKISSIKNIWFYKDLDDKIMLNIFYKVYTMAKLFFKLLIN